MLFESITKEEKTNLKRRFGRLDLEEDDNPRNKFKVGLLDCFDYCLSAEEASELLTGKEQLKNEPLFFNFFKEIYLLNGSEVYIITKDIDRLRSFSWYRFLKKEFAEEEYKILKKIIKSKETEFKVTDYKVLSIFVKLSTRTYNFSNFFFDNIDTAIIGNYDLSFPLYCLNEESFNENLITAQKFNLHIR